MTILKALEGLAPPFFTFLAGFVGVAYGIKQIRAQKNIDFIERQLNELYSPLLGIRKDIQAKTELRHKISEAANEAWKEICAQHSGEPFLDDEKYFGPFRQIIEYDNEQLEMDILPQYRQMQELIKQKMGLALPETRKWYIEVTNYIEIWNRWEQKSLPGEVIKRLNHDESKLFPLYEHIEKVVINFQNKLSNK